MKTLYSILGVDSAATSDQIEKAYTIFLSRLENAAGHLSIDEINNQKIAIRDAYTTLLNPILRQRYDQKLADADFTRLHVQDGASYEVPRGSIFGLKSIALVGIIVLSGLYFYNQNAKERERLRIAHEHEVQMKAVQIAEDQQKQNAKVQDFVLDRSVAHSDNQQLQMQQQKFERESAVARQQELQQKQLELQQQQQQRRDEESRQRQEENRLRQEQQRYQQQLQSDKRLLQQMERDRYGKIITH